MGFLFFLLQFFCQNIDNFFSFIKTAKLADGMRNNHFFAMRARKQNCRLESKVAPAAKLLAFGHVMSRYRHFCNRALACVWPILLRPTTHPSGLFNFFVEILKIFAQHSLLCLTKF